MVFLLGFKEGFSELEDSEMEMDGEATARELVAFGGSSLESYIYPCNCY